MAPRSNVPIRICGSKARTGCKTCKQRHVKCDEARPTCLNCRKGNRLCVYEHPVDQAATLARESTERVVSAEPRLWSLRVSPDLDIVLSTYGSREVMEVSAVKHFAVYMGRELAGCFSNDIWCHILPRVAQHEPAVWHAIVAVSILDSHLRRDLDRLGGDSDANTAVRYYSTAIRELNLQLRSSRRPYYKDVVMLTCLLFVVFECLQSHYQSALRHITGGMRLLMEWDQEAQAGEQSSPGGYFNPASLQPMFLSLDSQAVQMGAADFRGYCSLPAIGSQLETPVFFTTTEEAHLQLNRIFNRLSRWSYWIEPETELETRPDGAWIEAEGQRLGLQLTQWDSAFKILLDLFEEPAVFLLLTQRKVLQAYYNTSTDGISEMTWDKSLPLFQEAVQYAEVYIQLTASNRSSSLFSAVSRPIFTVAMDVVLSLYLICVKCRDPRLRRQALSLLKISDRKEGIWDSQICSVMAEKIIEFEERGADQNGFIPESARIYQLDLRLREEAKMDVALKKLISDEDGSQHTERFVEPLA